MSKRPVRAKSMPSELRRPEIIAAAAKAFWRNGYANTTIQEIADSVGLLKGSLYYHIDSKEDLLCSVISDVNEKAFQLIEEVRELEAPAIDRIAKLITLQTEFNIANRPTLTVYYHDFGLLPPARRKPILEQRRRYEAFIVEQIEQAMVEGSIDPSLDSKMAAYFLLGSVNWLYTWYDPAGSTAPAELGELFASLTLNGFRGARQDPPRRPRKSKPKRRQPAT